jgi:hypothetical protein
MGMFFFGHNNGQQSKPSAVISPSSQQPAISITIFSNQQSQQLAIKSHSSQQSAITVVITASSHNS